MWTKELKDRIIDLDRDMFRAGINVNDVSRATNMLIQQDGTHWVRVKLRVGNRLVGYETADMSLPYKEAMENAREGLERMFPEVFQTENWSITFE